MVSTLAQEDINVFGSDQQTVKEKPSDTLYADGVEVQYTAPAKWWNWLWNALTSWLTNHKADNQSMITEETNLLTSAGKTPSSSDSHQLSQCFEEITEAYAETYDNETVEEVGYERYVNKPYVSGAVVVLPDTELL